MEEVRKSAKKFPVFLRALETLGSNLIVWIALCVVVGPPDIVPKSVLV